MTFAIVNMNTQAGMCFLCTAFKQSTWYAAHEHSVHIAAYETSCHTFHAHAHTRAHVRNASTTDNTMLLVSQLSPCT